MDYTKWTEVDRVNQIESNRTDMDQMGSNGPNRSKWGSNEPIGQYKPK